MKNAIINAFPQTIPVMAGFLSFGIAFVSAAYMETKHIIKFLRRHSAMYDLNSNIKEDFNGTGIISK